MRRGFERVTGYKYINLPKRKTKQSAGYDIESAIDAVITPGETKLIPTGIKAYMKPYEWLGIYVRSSLAVKYGIILANSVAVIDSDYYNNQDNEGHILIALRNTSKAVYNIRKGDRIAQGVFHQYYKVDDDSADGDRTGGIGSTGK
ncbi:dUTP diphosphatase [Dialister invisus]|uniref:dUTP diphosphatase n=1 Tax=Dialister invisus TaxID=218538 RepID=UPI0026709A7B|nr:dUTP diphosphatase [Dialister invisus]